MTGSRLVDMSSLKAVRKTHIDEALDLRVNSFTRASN